MYIFFLECYCVYILLLIEVGFPSQKNKKQKTKKKTKNHLGFNKNSNLISLNFQELNIQYFFVFFW